MAEDLVARFHRVRRQLPLIPERRRELWLRCQLHGLLLAPVGDNDLACPAEECAVRVSVEVQEVQQ